MSQIAGPLMNDVETWKASLEAGLKLQSTDADAQLDYLLEQTKNVEIVVLSQLKDTLFDLNESQYWDFASKEVRDGRSLFGTYTFYVSSI